MSGHNLGWTSEDRDGSIILAPAGRVDQSTVHAFQHHLIKALETAPRIAVIDLSGVAYMVSQGLRALTLAQRVGARSGTIIVLARPNETMREILAISRYDTIFRVADTIEDAIGY